MKKTFIIFTTVIFTFALNAQSHFSTQSHQAQVTNVIAAPGANNDGSYFSTGEDGFIIKWADDNTGEHYQFTDVGIKLVAASPNGEDIAIYESDGGSVNRVSVWNWRTLSRKYQKKFNDSITSLKFSAKGNYLIIGTASVDGAVFVRTAGWTVVDKIKANTGIVNYVNTSDSEKTVVFYSPSGTLSFYDLGTGKLKQKMSIVNGLSQTVMFYHNKYFAGIKDNTIYVTASGKTVSKIEAQNPIILSTSTDLNLYYMENDGRGSYTIKMLENLENDQISNPRIVKTLRGPRGASVISAAGKDHSYFYFGSQNGAIYKTEVDPSTTTENLAEITENTYSKIYDMVPYESDFLFLTSNAVYKSSYDTGIVDKLSSTTGQTDICNYDESSLILWTKGYRNPVVKMDLDKKTSVTLFTPENNIQSLKVSSINDKKYIIEIESNMYVNLYNVENNKMKQIYSGAGVQDAILCNDGNMYIAKSAATNPQVPLLAVNINTLETVPIRIKGNVSYALSTNGSVIYGIYLLANENGALSTYVYSYNTATKQMSNILKFSNEDSEAFTYLNGNNLFTNIGKNVVYCYNLTTKKRISFKRSASIPRSVTQNGKRVVILNSNGSISWCDTSSERLLADWYFTNDAQWYEF